MQIQLTQVILETSRTSMLEYGRGINGDRLWWNISYVCECLPREQHDERSEFVIQDQL